MPESLEAAPRSGVTTIVTFSGCDKDWQLFCPTSEGYIRHFTSGLCLQYNRNDVIILTDDCWAVFEELPDKGGIVDLFSDGCIEPYDPSNKHLEKPKSFTPVAVNWNTDDECEPKDVQFFFNRD